MEKATYRGNLETACRNAFSKVRCAGDYSLEETTTAAGPNSKYMYSDD